MRVYDPDSVAKQFLDCAMYPLSCACQKGMDRFVLISASNRNMRLMIVKKEDKITIIFTNTV